MAHAAAMLGNSSSGLVEAPSFRLPAVNVGTRQGGRLRARNVVDCGCGRAEILRALRRALSPAFRASLRGMSSPYGDGRAAPRVARLLIKTPLPGLTDKRFADLQGGRHGWTLRHLGRGRARARRAGGSARLEGGRRDRD